MKAKTTATQAPLLKNLIRENMERRINLMKVSTVMEKVLSELSKEQSKKLTELFTQISELASQLNMTPYTKFNLFEWQLSLAVLKAKLYELKEDVVKLADKESKVNLLPLIRAIEEVCNN